MSFVDIPKMHRTEYATSGGTNLKERGPHDATPCDNFPSGDWKSHVYSSMAHYVPSERDWIKYNDYRSLPRETKRDAIDMQSEDQYVNFVRNRDTPSGYYYKDIGLKQTGVPENMLHGYTRNLPEMPPRNIFDNPWPKSDAYVPVDRRNRGNYYGYYHEAIDREQERRKRDFPASWRIEPRDVPTIVSSTKAQL